MAVNNSKKKSAIKEKYSKSQILGEIANNTDLSKKQVSAVMDELSALIERHVKKGSAGQFTLPGLLKIKTAVSYTHLTLPTIYSV